MPPRRTKKKPAAKVRKKGKPIAKAKCAPKRPWWHRLPPSERAHWREIEVTYNAEKARQAAETAIAEAGAETYRIAKVHRGIVGRGARLLSAVVGREVYERAESRYSGDLMARAARRLEVARKESEAKRAAGLAKLQVALKKKGFSIDEVERFKAHVRPRARIVKYHYWKAYGGSKRGQWKKVRVTPKGEVFLKWIKTARGVQSSKRYDLFRKRAAEVGNHLGVSFVQARRLVRDVEAQALKDLAKLKRTKGFKDLPKRKQLAYTERRWKAGSVAVLYALADIEGY